MADSTDKKITPADADYLIRDDRLRSFANGTTIYYDFLPGGVAGSTYFVLDSVAGSRTVEVGSDYKDATAQILQYFQSILNINFAPATEENPAKLRFASIPLKPSSNGNEVGGNQKNIDGVHYIALNSASALASDIRLNSFGYATLIHEIGHALGLDHPDVDGGGGSTSINVSQAVMAYRNVRAHVIDNEGFYAITPLVLDIEALTAKLGYERRPYNPTDTYVFLPGPTPRATAPNFLNFQ